MPYNLIKIRPTSNESPGSFVHLLNDNSILIIFAFCRPVIFQLSERELDDSHILGGGKWNRERWWHRLIQVCRRWRYLLLDSAFHLQVSLVCGRGTPVANILAHFPTAIPLVIDHFEDEYQTLTAEDEKGIILALQHRDRVRRIRLLKPTPILQKLIIALDGEFPILEFLLIWHQRYNWPIFDPIPNLNLPETFRAPHLRQLMLRNSATPIESPQLTTMANLTILLLFKIPSSAYFHPSVLLQRLSLMPLLETLGIGFNLGRGVEKQLLQTSIMTQVTLPNLCWLGFRGSSAYLEVLLPWVTTPLLEKLRIYFFNRMIYSVPHLRHFIKTARNFQAKSSTFIFCDNWLRVMMHPHMHMEANLHNFDMDLGGKHFDWQVVSAAQVFYALSTVFSTVDHLTLEYKRPNSSSEWNNEADRTHWRRLLGSFGKVKILSMDGEFVEQLSGALQPCEEESPTELLPELQKIFYPARGTSRNAFATFVGVRRKAGQHVTVLRS